MAKQLDSDKRVWKTTLKLTRWHWHITEDLAYALRRHGARYRSGPSPIVSGILDACLPSIASALARPERHEQGRRLAALVNKYLVGVAVGEAPAATRVAVAEFVADALMCAALDRADRVVRGRQRARRRRK